MNWLLIILTYIVIDSLVIYCDNYIADVYFKGKGSGGQKVVHGIGYILCSIILAFAFGFDFNTVPLTAIFLILLSGFISSFSGIFYYRALEIEDSTNLSIFFQLAPVLYLIYEVLVLGKSFTWMQLLALVLILSAPLLIILTTRKNSRKTKLRAILLTAFYVIFSVVGHIIFVQTNNNFEIIFLDAMPVLFFSKGVSNLLLVYVFNKKLGKRFNEVVKISKKKVLKPLILNNLVCLFKDFLYRYGLMIAPALTLASAASDSAEPFVIFIMGIILTLINPKFGREKINKKSVIVHLIATGLVIAGILLIQG